MTTEPGSDRAGELTPAERLALVIEHPAFLLQLLQHLIGIGEKVEDLQAFDAREFASALLT